MNVVKKALITGITGQDGSYLAELLLEKGYEVHGVIRHEENNTPKDNLWRIFGIKEKIVFHFLDITNQELVRKMIVEIKPDEIYHFATLHEVKNTLENYNSILRINLNSVYYFLASIKLESPETRFFFASSSRIFVGGDEIPQNERTPFHPNSLYGMTKVASTNLVRMFREQEGVFACSGIFFNHESPRRSSEFLTRKISKAVAEIKRGLSHELTLGNLDVRRDWGFAGDFVEAAWLMLQKDIPEDYIIGTGEMHSVKDFLVSAFESVGLDWEKYVKVDLSLVRPQEIELRADISKARARLGWAPKVEFQELVRMMIEYDLIKGGDAEITI